MDTLEQQLTKETILESNCQNAFRVLKTQFEKIFTFMLIKPSSLDGTYARKDFHAYTGMEPQLFKETILKKFDFIKNYTLKTISHAQTIQKRLDEKKLQIRECTTFIKSKIYLDDEYVIMTRTYFLQHTQLEILEFRDILIQHMESVKQSIDERALHKRKYDTRVNERQMQTTTGEVIWGSDKGGCCEGVDVLPLVPHDVFFTLFGLVTGVHLSYGMGLTLDRSWTLRIAGLELSVGFIVIRNRRRILCKMSKNGEAASKSHIGSGVNPEVEALKAGIAKSQMGICVGCSRSQIRVKTIKSLVNYQDGYRISLKVV
ncbi:hypothetical protein Tco_1208418 [Tanacetum coccineum]